MNKIEMYIAEDGRIFRTEGECLHYEKYEMETNQETGKPVRVVAIGESLV